MSSLSQREATGIWIMASSILPCEFEGLGLLKAAVDAVRPYVLPEPWDRAMRRVHKRLYDLVTTDEMLGQANRLPDDKAAAVFYMLHALVSDYAADCPPNPPARKRAWEALADVMVDMVRIIVEGKVDDGACAEMGCHWADKVREAWERA